MKELIVRFVRDESGVAAIEYGIICAMIAVAIVSSARNVGLEISNTFNKLTDAMR
jgi:pilus assembly protein Flp/PilA